MNLSKHTHTHTYIIYIYIIYIYNIYTCLLDHAYETPSANIKMDCQKWPEKPLILGRSGTQYVAMVTKLLSSYCGAHLVKSYFKESNISYSN